MPDTANLGLPYPGGTETPSPHVDIQQLAEALDTGLTGTQGHTFNRLETNAVVPADGSWRGLVAVATQTPANVPRLILATWRGFSYTEPEYVTRCYVRLMRDGVQQGQIQNVLISGFAGGGGGTTFQFDAPSVPNPTYVLQVKRDTGAPGVIEILGAVAASAHVSVLEFGPPLQALGT